MNEEGGLKVALNEGDSPELNGPSKVARKFINLLWHLRREHPRALPNVLLVMDALIRRWEWFKDS